MRGPLDQQPAEPGWWQASDFKWYPPEAQPGWATQPTRAAGPETVAASEPVAWSSGYSMCSSARDRSPRVTTTLAFLPRPRITASTRRVSGRPAIPTWDPATYRAAASAAT